MKYIQWVYPGLLACAAALAQNNSTVATDLEEIQVLGDQAESSEVKLFPEESSILTDTAEILKNMPGATVNRNGALSGIAQYRGLFGSRVNVQADGIQVMESCSNSMDAAMSHVPSTLVEAVTLQRGITPVSQGIETLGGRINVLTRSVLDNPEGFSGNARLGMSSANDGQTAALMLAHRSNRHAWQVGIDDESGDNVSFPGGHNVFTGLDRRYYTAAYGYKTDGGSVRLNWNYNDTGETGTPSLPMDITYARGGITALDWAHVLASGWSLSNTWSYQNTEHVMDNHRHRNTTAGLQRESYTEVTHRRVVFEAEKESGANGWHLGLAWDATDNDALISNPENTQFNIINFDTERQRSSVFAEWTHALAARHRLTAGLRWTRVNTDAADVFSTVSLMDTAMGQLHRTLQDRFNQSDRDRSDDHVDLSLQWHHALNDAMAFEYGLSVKHRAPSHQERYLWLPLEATAGLADGRQYLGDPNLDPERAVQLEWGMNYSRGPWRVSPHVFLQRIDDYIQGTPNTVMPAPEGTLRYSNVDAQLYGLDADIRYQASDRLTLNNVTTLVRGERRDIDDNLYRIAPFSSRFGLQYHLDAWQFSAELLGVKRQNRVSDTNAERSTPGFGLLNLNASRKFGDNHIVKLAIFNALDKRYYEHTNGYNRNNLNVDVGFDPNDLQRFRLPGSGRDVRLSWLMNW